MNSHQTFEIFYSAIIQAFLDKNYDFSERSLIEELKKNDSLTEAALSHAKVMLSSWSEFLNDLFLKKNIANLTGHLLNHIHFLKFLPDQDRKAHLIMFYEVLQALFEFIILNHIIYNESAEFEEDIKELELGLYQFENRLNPVQLSFYFLRRNATEINEVTEKYMTQVLENLYSNKMKKFHQALNELKAIQETITTVLQMDREEETSPLIIRLKNEFNLINQFYSILKEYVEAGNSIDLFNYQFEVRATFDYPFLDALKNISRWYSERNKEYLETAKSALNLIAAKKPFRKEDILISDTINGIYDLTLEFESLESDGMKSLCIMILEIFSDPKILLALKKYAFDYFENGLKYPHLIGQNLVPHLNIILKLCTEENISALYRKKMFKYILIIIKDLGQRRVFTIEQIKKYIKIVHLIDEKLQSQAIVKLGEFKKISYKLPDNYLLAELERGFASQLLYALEDFVDWDEGKEMMSRLNGPAAGDNPRINIMEKFMMVATEIADYRDLSEDIPASGFIKTEIIRNVIEKIIVEPFPQLDKNIKYFYAVILIHILNLAFDNGMISSTERIELLNLIKKNYLSGNQRYPISLINFKESELFSESYEHEFASIVNLWQIYLPIYQTNPIEKRN